MSPSAYSWSSNDVPVGELRLGRGGDGDVGGGDDRLGDEVDLGLVGVGVGGVGVVGVGGSAGLVDGEVAIDTGVADDLAVGGPAHLRADDPSVLAVTHVDGESGGLGPGDVRHATGRDRRDGLLLQRVGLDTVTVPRGAEGQRVSRVGVEGGDVEHAGVPAVAVDARADLDRDEVDVGVRGALERAAGRVPRRELDGAPWGRGGATHREEPPRAGRVGVGLVEERRDRLDGHSLVLLAEGDVVARRVRRRGVGRGDCAQRNGGLDLDVVDVGGPLDGDVAALRAKGGRGGHGRPSLVGVGRGRVAVDLEGDRGAGVELLGRERHAEEGVVAEVGARRSDPVKLADQAYAGAIGGECRRGAQRQSCDHESADRADCQSVPELVELHRQPSKSSRPCPH